MSANISVVICVYNGADTLADCLRAVEAQSLARDQFEIIVVDDGSTDDSAEVARRFQVRLQQGPHRGLAAARNTGWRTALGEWVAFTDDDCAPTRNWLLLLQCAVQRCQPGERVLGAAGRIVGFTSNLDVPRYVELRGGLNTDQHLEHPLFPYAPMGNAMYRREALEVVRGLDERYYTYESCDLHTRLRREYGGEFYYEPRAIVFHRHHTAWQDYFRQQYGYGRGVAQFMWHYRQEVPWSAHNELAAWVRVLKQGSAALAPATYQRTLLRRGDFVKHLARRIGFTRTYWDRRERTRW
jgi:glycosyltransferase involved in cell wall biosynthesis